MATPLTAVALSSPSGVWPVLESSYFLTLPSSPTSEMGPELALGSWEEHLGA